MDENSENIKKKVQEKTAKLAEMGSFECKVIHFSQNESHSFIPNFLKKFNVHLYLGCSLYWNC